MRDPFAALPPLGPRVELTIALPARNEEQTIGAAIAALARQRDRDGSPLSFERYDTILFANECADATALHARALARSYPGFQLYVVIGTLPSHAAHVGTARKYVMDAAARRFVAGRPNGTIATTDADTVVDAAWVAETLAEARSADAVMGRIMLAPSDRARLPKPARALYLREMAYRRIVGELEAVRDPIPCDPLPRHGQHDGASFAVSVGAYQRAGGVPPRERLEDLALFEALQRIDARVRHACACGSTRRRAHSPGSKAGSEPFYAISKRAANGKRNASSKRPG